jgi:hypothetical protein
LFEKRPPLHDERIVAPISVLSRREFLGVP